ncbi:MAG: hypothetical protein HQL54_05945 [Magnetococcales bacterium]|nr:hypothetical protein [Magnetococcales bacterium]
MHVSNVEKKNCWDFFECGRDIFSGHPKGPVCNVSITTCHNGKNDGTNAGRYCWQMPGSICEESAIKEAGGREPRGGFSFKEERCRRCEFKELVKQEQGDAYRE